MTRSREQTLVDKFNFHNDPEEGSSTLIQDGDTSMQFNKDVQKNHNIRI